MRDLIPRRHSISLRLVARSLLLSLIVSVVVTAVQLYVVYRSEVSGARQELSEMNESVVPNLAVALWQVDTGRVSMLMDGLLRIPGVAYVRLDSEGQRVERGDLHANALVEARYPLSYEDGKRFDLGTLEVVMGKQKLFADLRNASGRIMLTTLATLVAGAMLLLLLFQVDVTRHLETMAQYARHLDLDRLETPLELSRGSRRKHIDELDFVAQALNQMRERMVEELALRVRHERELEVHREHLESLVHARTAALERQKAQIEQQREELQRLANTDSLTGVNSRRHFLQRFGHEIVRARRIGRPLAVMMLDIDHFKRINDSHGHAVGDRVLAALSEVCMSELRDMDSVGRMGGEEFALLLPESDSLQARLVAERLRRAVEHLEVFDGNGNVVAFTVSIGICELDGHLDDTDSLLARADDELYRAKRSGRNRICVSGDAA